MSPRIAQHIGICALINDDEFLILSFTILKAKIVAQMLR